MRIENEVVKLIKAFRTGKHTIKCMYKYVDGQEFVISWSNIHEGSGNVIEYCLDENYCLAGDELIMEKIYSCMVEGESDTNENIELYLAIRDTFNSNDCEEI